MIFNKKKTIYNTIFLTFPGRPEVPGVGSTASSSSSPSEYTTKRRRRHFFYGENIFLLVEMNEIYWWKIDRLNGKYLSLLLRRISFIIIVVRAWRKSTLRRNDTIVEKNRPLKNRPLMTWITTTYLFWWFQCYVTRIRRPATRWDAAVVNKIFKGRRGFIIARYIHHI